MHSTARTRIGALGATAALSLVLAACGDSAGSMDHSSTGASSTSSSAAPVDAQHDDQDVVFAQQMIVHHQSAVEMARTAADKASSQEVEDLARSVEAAQGPEIETMTSWLNTWGEPVTPDGAMGGTHHSSGDVPGMMSGEQMTQLQTATGADFDEVFLRMMTAHHQGAVEMARTEQSEGSNPQAVALAGEIVSAQTAEIAEMERLLAGTGA
jgi:uncharacterized protein (DUF305 family)